MDYEQFVLKKLLDKRYIGEKQTLIENIPKNVPKKDQKKVRKAVKSLVRKGLLLTKKKHYGVHVSLNPRMLKQIKEAIE